jgi:hypothetical protein
LTGGIASTGTGKGTEQVTVGLVTTFSDSGVGSDAPAPQALLTHAETGIGTESPTLQYTATPTENGGGTEHLTFGPLVAASDNGNGTGTLRSITAEEIVPERGAFTDAPGLVANLSAKDTGQGTEAKATVGLTITAGGTGADSLRSILTEQIIPESLLGSESELFPEEIPATIIDNGVGVELAYLNAAQGQISVDGTSFSHVLTIQLDELVNMTNLPASDGLPNQVYQGGKGRKLTITGYTTDPAELAMLLGLAENSKHFFMLPTGESFYAYVAQIPKPKKAEDGVIYSYSFVAQEAID